jgi:hypothetical protein
VIFSQLIKKYDLTPEKLYPEDLFPLVKFLIDQRITIPKNLHTNIRMPGEADMPNEVTGIFVLRPENKRAKTSIITIGVHGNEIWAGALCVLEVLSQHAKGTLTGNVIIQIGNIKAVEGYMKAYAPEKYFLDRNGWRETNGIEREVSALHCDDESRVDMPSDFNRIPRGVMTLPRGHNFNVDRAQELLWLYRAFLRGFRINDDAKLYKADAPYDIRFVMHPHTSRMVGGIRNIALPPLTIERFFSGCFDTMLSGLHDDLTTLLQWEKGGLGGGQNLILDEHIEIEHLAEKEFVETLPLIITFELGHHEDFCPNRMTSLADLCGPATRTLLENASFLKDSTPNKKPVNIKTLHTEPYRLDLSYYDGFSALEEGDMVYLVTQVDSVDASTDYITGHFPNSIIVHDDGTCDVIKTTDITANKKGRIFYCMPPFELSYLKAGQPLMIAFGLDKKAKFLTVPYDMYAVFTGDCRLEFPIVHWRAGITTQKTFFRGVTEDMRNNL